MKVIKKSGKPFKSGLKVNTVKSTTTNQNTLREAYIFEEDDSVVDVIQCKEYKVG